jgi:hypothetical protein
MKAFPSQNGLVVSKLLERLIQQPELNLLCVQVREKLLLPHALLAAAPFELLA